MSNLFFSEVPGDERETVSERDEMISGEQRGCLFCREWRHNYWHLVPLLLVYRAPTETIMRFNSYQLYSPHRRLARALSKRETAFSVDRPNLVNYIYIYVMQNCFVIHPMYVDVIWELCRMVFNRSMDASIA